MEKLTNLDKDHLLVSTYKRKRLHLGKINSKLEIEFDNEKQR